MVSPCTMRTYFVADNSPSGQVSLRCKTRFDFKILWQNRETYALAATCAGPVGQGDPCVMFVDLCVRCAFCPGLKRLRPRLAQGSALGGRAARADRDG